MFRTPATLWKLALALVLALPASARLAAGAAVWDPTRAPGAQLRQGMELRYQSGGTAQPAWTVDSVRLGAALRPAMDCAVVWLRRNPDRLADESRLCVGNDTLYRHDGKSGEWAISRPVGPGMTWSSRQTNGDQVRYQTASWSEETISGRVIPVLATIILTSDSLGRPKRRLRERYALSLTTATGGVFEVPDSAADGGWKVRQEFELREIRAGR